MFPCFLNMVPNFATKNNFLCSKVRMIFRKHETHERPHNISETGLGKQFIWKNNFVILVWFFEELSILSCNAIYSISCRQFFVTFIDKIVNYIEMFSYTKAFANLFWIKISLWIFFQNLRFFFEVQTLPRWIFDG